MKVNAVMHSQENDICIRKKLILSKNSRCVIIGQGNLPLACANLLLEQGAIISAVISTDKLLLDWAQKNAIPNSTTPDDLPNLLNHNTCDFLFSIVNPFILNTTILATAKICAINYHDSPLPRYAGTNATSWALMAGESSHAVTWHVMATQVDAGDILQQETVSISAQDTSLTLNLKCQNAALTSFKILIDNLQQAKADLQQQPLNIRTFFPSYMRPYAAGCLLWNKTAEELSALVRGLDFGVFQNPLALPKIRINNEYILVGKLTILEQLSQFLPGCVTTCNDNSFIVTTKNFNVSLGELRTIDGQPLPFKKLANHYITERFPLTSLDSSSALTLTNLSGKFARHENFWVDYLQHEPYPTGLSFVKATISHQSTDNYAQHICEIPNTLLASANDSETRINWLLTTLAIYLARINSETNLNIGLHETTLAKDIGQFSALFADTLPMQLQIDLDLSFMELAEKVAQQRLLLAKHGSYARDIALRYPVLRELPKLPVMDRWPLVVQVLDDVIDNKKINSSNNGQLITLQISADGYYCNWRYNTALIDTRLIERVAKQFFTLLNHAITTTQSTQQTNIDSQKIEKKIKVGFLPLLDEAETQRVLVDWNATQVNYPKDNCIHELIEAQAEQHPQATALVFEHLALSYQQLNDRANQFAHYLRSKNITTGSLVGLSMERGLDMIVGILAIFKAGAAYVPLDPTYPSARLEYILNDSGVKNIVTSTTLAQSLYQQTHHSKICLDNINVSREVAEYPHHNIAKQSLQLIADNIAYVIYTSGSTGKPKGTLVRHSGLCNLAIAQIEMFSVKPKSKVLQFASMSFDAAISECMMALCAGAALVLITKDTTQSAEKLNLLIDDKKITHVTLPPVLLPLMDLNCWTSVETLAVAGEACSTTQANIWSQGRRFINAYGPTETTVCASMGLYSPEQAVLHIGKPMNNTQLYVVNKYLQPQPIGVAGELLIGGVGLAVGYLHQPDLTAEKFIVNPFSEDTESRLYKTGDLVRWLENGNLEFLGRIDHQVKIRGFRIELGEIENCLLQHSQVREALVIVREDNSKNKTLAAYLIINNTSTKHLNDAEINATIKQHLQASLPDYMVPTSLTFLSAIPLTPNGKVDRNALPQPIISVQTQDAYVAPQTELEHIFCNVWQNVLQLEHVGMTDNFFQLGGNSILVFYTIVQLSRLGVEITPENIYEAPTITQLIQFAKLTNNQNKKSSVVQQDNYALVTGRAPVLPNALVIMEDWKPNHWNSSFILKLAIPYSEPTLHQAISRLLNHHDALRTLWREENGVCYQYFQSPDEMLPWWQVVDLSHLNDEDAIVEIERQSAAAQYTLNLSSILFKAIYFNLGDARHSRLLFVLHHMLIDNYSHYLFLNDLGRLCNRIHNSIPIELPPKTTSVKSLAEAYERYISHPELEEDLHYWLNRPWHQYHPMPKETEPENLSKKFTTFILRENLTSEETELLESGLLKENISLQDVLLTALVMAYGEWAGRKALVVSLTNHGRSCLPHESIDLSRTIGLLPIHSMYFLVLPENISLRDSIDYIKNQREKLAGKEASHILLKNKHHNAEVRQKMLDLPPTQLALNIFGRQPKDMVEDNYGLLWTPENVGPLTPPVGESLQGQFIPYSLAEFESTTNRLAVQWACCSLMYTEKTMRSLLSYNMAAVRTLIQCLQ